MRRCIAEKLCRFAIVAHDGVHKSQPGGVDNRIRAELEYARLLLGRVGIASESVRAHPPQPCYPDKTHYGLQRAYVQMERKHMAPSKL